MARTFDGPSGPVASPPLAGAIYWTAYSAIEGDYEPLDPLRLNMYAQRLGNLLLPGITARTERLRYLGMVCAGLQQTSVPGDSVKLRRLRFLPFERGWALAVTLGVEGQIKYQPAGQSATRLKPEFRGLRGANRVLRHWRTVERDQKISPSSYTLLSAQESQGGLGAYLVTLRHYGFVHADTLNLTARGRDLAAAFERDTPGQLRDLTEPAPVSRSKLKRLGTDLTVAGASEDEKAIGRATLFGGPDGMAEVIRRMGAVGERGSPESGLAAIADPNGDSIARAAGFAVDFDPLRRSLLNLFASFGRQLEGHAGPLELADLVDDELIARAEAARDAAAVVAQHAQIAGLEPISVLARELAAGRSVDDTVRSVVAFHRAEGRAWIVDHGGDRYAVGRHGAFDATSDHFHGYTVGSALQLLADCEATT